MKPGLFVKHFQGADHTKSKILHSNTHHELKVCLFLSEYFMEGQMYNIHGSLLTAGGLLDKYKHLETRSTEIVSQSVPYCSCLYGLCFVYTVGKEALIQKMCSGIDGYLQR